MSGRMLDNARRADNGQRCGFTRVPSSLGGTYGAEEPLTKGERRILELIKRCDFTGQGCWPTQDELAFISGYKRPYVNACVKSLERKGHLRIEKRRAAGCKWTHNVYFARDWSPNVRRGIVNLRSAFKDSQARRSSCSQASSDTERTARPSRAQTPGVNPFLTEAVVNQRGWSRGENGLSRRTWMQEARFSRQRHLTVPDLTCPKCQELAQELDEARRINREGAIERSNLVEEISSGIERDRVQGREIRRLKGELTKQQNQSARLEQIEQVVEHWRSHRKKASKAFGKPGSKSFKTIEAALVLMADEDDPVGACCEAIDGLHLAPYQEFDRRFATDGPGRTLRNDVEHALGDESRIERCRAMKRRADNLSLDAKRRAYDTSLQVHEAWSRALFGELWSPPAEPEDMVVDGIVVRP